MMKVWDDYGRVGEITREEWRTQVLPHNFRANWNKPDDLANLINSALNDGFIPDSLEPARQLQRIDPQPKRAINLLAFVLLKVEKLDEAEQLLNDALKKHGRDALLLNNLAKVHSAQNKHAEVESTLWEALTLDPNVENTFGWYLAIHQERGGDAAASECLSRIAALAGSWRAQAWIARAALKSNRLQEALDLYRECLTRVGKPAPADLLQQISGDLGNAGHLPEILQSVAPHFDATAHGLMVGNNLIKAYFDLGQLDAARQILDQLYRQNRGDWKEHLSFWDTQIAKARVSLHETPKEIPPVAMLTIAGPVWLKPESPAAELFPAKETDAPTVALIGSAAEIITNSKRAQHQMADTPGRMSRALPLFLAEQLEFGSNARVQTLVPWLTGEAPAFVFSGGPWEDADAAAYARQTEGKSDYIVTAFLKPNAEPWSVDLRLVRTIDAKCLGTLSGSFPAAQPEAGLPALAKQLLSLLREHAEVQVVPSPPQYQLPGAPWFSTYLLRLEQLLAVRCSTMDGVPSGFLSGEREIVDGNLQLCLEHPQNVGVRIQFAQTLQALKRARPAMVTEYREKIARLQREKPLSEPAHSVVQRMLNEVLA
jgi:tetratricopeptide (TPR) repeat protein